MYLRDHEITELPLYRLNTILERQELVMHAAKVRDPKRFCGLLGQGWAGGDVWALCRTCRRQ